MKVFGKIVSPAVIIIFAMVLINAGIFFYFDHRGNVADQHLRTQIMQNEKVARQNRQLIKSQENERLIRTDENCEFAERTHLRDVQDLRGTYSYLIQAEASPAEKNTLLYKLILKQVPRTIANGETDLAPTYCDQKGYGLKEPDPVIPKRPDFLPKSILTAADRLKTKGIRLDNQPIDPVIHG